MILIMNGQTLINYVATFFAYAFTLLDTSLFTWGNGNISLWNICLSFIGMSIFVDFLHITGVWGYSEDEFDMEGD